MRNPIMTPSELERGFLSMRCWLQRIVLPSAAVLAGTLFVFGRMTRDDHILDHNAVIVGFFIFYFVLVRGGHLIMIRSMHKDMMKKYEAPYTARLAAIPLKSFRRRNLGFTLAKIKRELIDQFGVK